MRCSSRAGHDAFRRDRRRWSKGLSTKARARRRRALELVVTSTRRLAFFRPRDCQRRLLGKILIGFQALAAVDCVGIVHRAARPAFRRSSRALRRHRRFLLAASLSLAGASRVRRPPSLPPFCRSRCSPIARSDAATWAGLARRPRARDRGRDPEGLLVRSIVSRTAPQASKRVDFALRHGTIGVDASRRGRPRFRALGARLSARLWARRLPRSRRRRRGDLVLFTLGVFFDDEL